MTFEKPAGTRDFLPERIRRLSIISTDIKEILNTWGYEEIDTPQIEYFHTVGVYSKIPEEKMVKFLDPLGKTVILRPDYTTPIARFVASTYKDVSFPIRLMYQGKVYTNWGPRGIMEKNQIGMELIGLPSLEADAEVICLAVLTIQKSTQVKFKVAVGHTKFLKLLLNHIGCQPSVYELLAQKLLARDYVAYKEIVNNLPIQGFFKDCLLRILRMRGSLENILEGQTWFDTDEWQAIFQELLRLWEILEEHGVTDHVSLDLSLLGQQNYYTGMIYHLYCQGHPYPVLSGGRYDNLLESFGRPGPAAGFAINLDDLLELIN